MDAKIASAPSETEETKPADAKESNEKYFEEQQKEEDTLQLQPPELDNTGVIEDQTGDEEYSMGNPDNEISDENLEKANELRDAALAAFNEGMLSCNF